MNRITRNKQVIKSAFSLFTKNDLELCNEMLEGFVEDLQQLKSSLPTEQGKVVVPPYVDDFLSVGNKTQKLACFVSCKYSILSCDMVEGELKQWLREISMDDLLSLPNGYIVEKNSCITSNFQMLKQMVTIHG